MSVFFDGVDKKVETNNIATAIERAGDVFSLCHTRRISAFLTLENAENDAHCDFLTSKRFLKSFQLRSLIT